MEAVDNVSRWVGKPQAPFDIDCEASPSTFRIAEIPSQYAIHSRIYHIKVSAVIFSWTGTGNDKTDEVIEPRALFQRA